MTIKVREVIKKLEADGWYLNRVRGSHRQYHHAEKPSTVTVAGHPSDDVDPGTWNSIQNQAGWR